ncbi:hypothetical protein ABB37_02313 [Leptomonas pyrrhocoris]|uniref:Golgi apparatus membrane protein TVP23 homolog n=1 Tax=Leptomonas pyrrhocoris TaxID=157538 RepID=A0A0N0DYL2_LEPPY|nr:hypothetical protein ABB37_02313 [Leptomonas pyrrhocoris]XP_015662725.1 hypothetical protein ABB37_02313 [Leptomonas pyrrhocoris]XP_015662726.1 hypothetical protein ABB37_02313 [Leptomonas pyrrhocoris]XP_015662727.1 hypothetical protein ABB37_02313 [Leptomonas pyrrhocoris]KPA84285.1 hypothetical protein ABB37_02313 [Leptomonas pyrrhocoris]KPA84286.1 hypothetical protein ABB37_02313 [Leptomonas pyrrhocoris]KPA84287.1 hypothetical protein ABB37_02313 [Leptomonas pyrrhocoris]KPA84288.1 hypot|eukprot:XP_015662724.1 hypothetical protein ABB37_02313 [Leptomonas pyrrhocoris]
MDHNSKSNFDFSSAPAVQGGADGGVPPPAFSSGAPDPNVNFGSAAAPEGQTILVDTVDHGGYKGVHPIAALFHAVFKIAAVLVYIFGGTFGMSYVVLLVVTILLLAADFWTTKNITGRILVSMRWRNEVKDDGSTEWLFESSPEADQRVNAYDNWFFWVLLIGNFVAWVVLLLLNLFTLKYLPIKLAAITLAGANLYGYFKCRRDAQQRLTNFMLTQAVNRPQTAGRVASFFMGGGASGPPAAAPAAPAARA